MISIKKILLCISFMLSASFTSASLGAGTILSIESKDFGKEELEVLQKALKLRVGEKLNADAVDEGLKGLRKSQRFQRVIVESDEGTDGVRLYLRGSKIRILRTITFTNIPSAIVENSKGTDGIEVGSAIDLARFSQLRERIKEEYEARGYYFSEVDILISDAGDKNEVDVEVSAKPGEPTRIGKVSILGAPAKEASEILEVVRMRKGDIFTRDDVEVSKEAIHAYLKKNRYPTSKVEEVGLVFSENKLNVDVSLTVKLGERFQFEFYGNHVFETVLLRELLTTEILSQNDAPKQIAALIEAKYRSVGFHFVSVKVESSFTPQDRIHRVRFNITENSRVIIDDVHFSGVDQEVEDYLKGEFYREGPPVLQRGLYWEEGTASTLRKITKKAETKGYLRAQIQGPRIAFSDDKRGVQLFFDADLGNQTRLTQIRITGNRYFTSESLEAELELKTGEPVNPELFERAQAIVIEKYKREGFVDVTLAETSIKDALIVSSDQKTAEFRITIKEGIQYFVGDFQVEGNKRTKDYVILREVELKKGDKFNPDLLRASEGNIAGLGLFSRFEFIAETNPISPNIKDIKIVVVEIKPGLGEIGLGAAYEEPRFRLKSFLGLAYRNVAGRNQTASLRTEVGVPLSRQKDVIPFIEYAAVVGYRIPYPLGVPINLSTQIGLDSFELANSDTTTLQTRARIEERLEKRISKKVTGYYRLHRYENTTLEELGTNTGKKTESIGSTGPGLVVDLRNDPFNPTLGSFHSFDVELSHPYLLSQDDIAFVMAVSRNSFYFPLFDPISVAFYIGGGYARSLLDTPLPTARLKNDLALGGQGSIRGYSPKEYQPGLNLTDPSLNPRETAFINGRIELTTLLFDNVSGAIFFDSGELFPRWIPAGRRDGIGMGVRYKTPVGPVVIDIAHGFQSRDKNVKFSFTIGSI